MCQRRNFLQMRKSFFVARLFVERFEIFARGFRIAAGFLVFDCFFVRFFIGATVDQ